MKTSSNVVAVLVLLMFAGASFADEKPKMGKSTKGKVTHRLPNNYGKVGISKTQREKIYSIQSEYRTRIQDLLQELEDLRTQQSLEIQSVLTEAQKKELKSLLEASRKKRAASKAKK